MSNRIARDTRQVGRFLGLRDRWPCLSRNSWSTTPAPLAADRIPRAEIPSVIQTLSQPLPPRPESLPHTITKIPNKIPSESLPSCPFLAEINLRRAFRVYKNLESQGQRPDLDKSELISTGLPTVCAARVLGFGPLRPPSDIGRDNLATDIIGCNESRGLLGDLAHLYVLVLWSSVRCMLHYILYLANTGQFMARGFD